MTRLTLWIAPVSLATLLFLEGCGGSGQQEKGTDAGGAALQNPAQGKPSNDAAAKEPVAGSIDPTKVPPVVAGEVKGGEASRGPSRTDHLWLLPDPKTSIQDEPLTVEVPKGLPPLIPGVYVPLSNPLTKAKFELGKQLYFEPRISKNTTISCATCHNPEKSWTDKMATSIGIFGQVGGRSAPTVLNTVYGRSMFWDGRAPSLEGQSQGPPQNKIEMGDQSYEEIVDRLRAIPGYRDQFKKVFGTDVTLDGIAKAIATFERAAALTGNSAYDKYQDPSEPDHNKALTDSQKRGMVLFGLQLNGDDTSNCAVGGSKGNCTACHAGFNFSDEQFHNLGVGWKAADGVFADQGRYSAELVGAKNPADLGSFKTPTCRNVEKTGPYMHDGSERTLEAVVEFYDKGGNPNPTLDKEMRPLKLTSQEKADLVAFLKALTGESPKLTLPTLPPGPDGKSPNPKDALEAPPMKTAGLNSFHAAFVR